MRSTDRCGLYLYEYYFRRTGLNVSMTNRDAARHIASTACVIADTKTAAQAGNSLGRFVGDFIWEGGAMAYKRASNFSYLLLIAFAQRAREASGVFRVAIR